MSGNWREKIGENGTHWVISQRTGKVYVVEPIKPSEKYKGKPWGDEDPATGKLTGSYGVKHEGAITADNSVITEENGFKNIQIVQGSPYYQIELIDAQYPTINREDEL